MGEISSGHASLWISSGALYPPPLLPPSWAITIAMNHWPLDRRSEDWSMKAVGLLNGWISGKRWVRSMRRSFTMVELLVVLAIIGVLVGLLLPAIQQAREAARRMQCQNNLKQLGLATHLFESSRKVFPASGWTTSGPGNPQGKFVGWRTLIMPNIEQSNVRQLYDTGLNWWEGTNVTVGSIPIPIMQCPSVPQGPQVMTAVAKSPRPALTFTTPLARTDYEAIQGVQPASIDTSLYNASNRFAVMHRNSTVRFADIIDGTSQTLMIVECGGRPSVYQRGKSMSTLSNDQGIGWIDSEGAFSLDGSNADGSLEGCGIAQGCNGGINRRNNNELYSFHVGSCQVLFADGHVGTLSESMDIMVLAAISTRAAGEVVVLD